MNDVPQNPSPSPGQSFARHLVAIVRAGFATERWGLLISVLTFVSALWLYAGSIPAHTPGSDGFYSWIYARSLAFDGDIHFANDYALCGDPFRIGIDRGTGRPDNIFYVGPAVVWVPMLWILRLVFRGYSAAATCGHPFSTIVLGLSPVLGGITAWMCYRLARRQFSDGIAALAVALLVLGGPVLKFASVLPSYSHVHDALAVCALVELTLRASDAPEKISRWIWVALALAVCVLQRLSNVMFVAVPIFALLLTSQRPQKWAGSLVVIGAGAFLGLALQGAIYQYLYGSPFTFSHGPYFLHLGHAHPFLLLFDQEEGLFHFTPTVWISVIGLYPAMRDKPARVLLVPLCIVAVLEIFLSSAALDWSPARRLTNLTPLWVLLACYPLRALGQWLETPSRSLAAAGLLFGIPFAASSMGYAWGASRGKFPVDRPISLAEAQGISTTSFLSMMEEKTGSLSVLPAEIAFAIRYRMPHDRFGDAAYASWYTRDFRTLRWGQRNLPFSSPRISRLVDGLAIDGGEAKPVGSRARMVFAVQWPFATHIKVRASAKSDVAMRVGFGRALGAPVWCGEAKPVPREMGDVEFVIPEGSFSSGIQEIVFEWSGGDGRDVVLQSISLDDRVKRPLPFAR